MYILDLFLDTVLCKKTGQKGMITFLPGFSVVLITMESCLHLLPQARLSQTSYAFTRLRSK